MVAVERVRAARSRCAPLVLVALLGCGGGGADGDGLFRAPEHRLLVVGWDGATFDLIDPLLAQGRLPTLQRMIDGGATAELESTVVPISSAAWTTAVTGKGPGETGVYAFLEPVEDSYDVRLISSRSNRAAPIWRTLTGRGLRVNVVGVPVTFPPEPVFGTMIAGMLSPFDADYAYPPELTAKLRERDFVPDLGVWREAQDLSWNGVQEQLALKEEIVLDLLRRDDWAFSMIVFKNLDVLSHRVYDGSTETFIAQLLVKLDETLGRLMDAVGPETNVIVMSDHGFATYRGGLNLHAWMLAEGFSVAAESGGAAGEKGKDFAESKALAHRARMAGLDMAKTRAFAATCEGNFGSVRLNLAGREPEGIVAPEEADALIEDVAARLRETGRATEVFRGSEMYPGPERAAVPDLLFEIDSDYHAFVAAAGEVWVDYDRPAPDHARTGILALSGPSVANVAERGRADLLDVAPTLLHLLDQPVYTEMRGRARTELLLPGDEPRFLREADDPTRRLRAETGDPYSADALRELEERIQALGYGG